MRVLLIEDDTRIAANIVEFLSAEAFAVDHVVDGKMGYEMAGGNVAYDVVVCDRMLPGMEWSQIVRELRERGVKTPVLMLTAMDSTDHRIEGLDAGADDYLVKPFSLRELLARIRALMRRSFDHLQNGNELAVGDLRISLATKKVTREGKDIKLSRKQFELLEYLMRNAGRIVSKAEIEEHIWDRNADLWSDVVRSHIQTLRAKVDKPFEKQLIKTVHGMGYGIDE